MQETSNHPGTTMHHAFGHTKMGETKMMGQTKRSSVDAVAQSENNKRKTIDEDDEENGKPHKKGPPVAIPGVNTSSFLGITRLKVPAVSSIVRELYFNIYSTRLKMALICKGGTGPSITEWRRGRSTRTSRRSRRDQNCSRIWKERKRRASSMTSAPSSLLSKSNLNLKLL